MYAIIRNKARIVRAAAASAVALVTTSVLAAVPESVNTALGALEDDVTTIAGLAFAAFLVIVAFRYFKTSAR